MHPRSSLSLGQRERLVEWFEAGYGSRAAATRMGVGRDVVRKLERRWKLHGRLCLVSYSRKRSYSFETKKAVVERYLAGETAMEIAAACDLSSDQIVLAWVRVWREGGEDALHPKPKGRPKGPHAARVASEEDRLRKQVQRLEAENAYLKKLRDLRGQGYS